MSTLETPESEAVDTSLGAPPGTGLVVLCAANSWDDVKLEDSHTAERPAAHALVLYAAGRPVVATSLPVVR